MLKRDAVFLEDGLKGYVTIKNVAQICNYTIWELKYPFIIMILFLIISFDSKKRCEFRAG